MTKKIELNNSGGAEATLKILEHIDEQSIKIQHTIWKNKPLKASKMLKKLGKETDFLEEQVLGLSRSLNSLAKQLDELEQLNENDLNSAEFVALGLQFLREGNWGAAADSVEKAIAALGPQGLERSLSIINRHLNELGDLSDSEEVTLNLIREARQKLAKDDFKAATAAFERAISVLGSVPTGEALSPFLVNNFFLSIESKWPESTNNGLMVVTVENLGDNNMSPMRMSIPTPLGWVTSPKMTEIPEIPPEGYIEIGVEMRPSGSITSEKMLGRKLAITTGYLANYGHLKVQIRVENRTLKSMEGIILDPWLPEGFEAMRLPFVQNLGPGQKVYLEVDILNVGKN
jgi:hypothetical protein